MPIEQKKTQNRFFGVFLFLFYCFFPPCMNHTNSICCHCVQHFARLSSVFSSLECHFSRTHTPASKTKKNLKFFPHSCACELRIVSNDSTENETTSNLSSTQRITIWTFLWRLTCYMAEEKKWPFKNYTLHHTHGETVQANTSRCIVNLVKIHVYCVLFMSMMMKKTTRMMMKINKQKRFVAFHFNWSTNFSTPFQ